MRRQKRLVVMEAKNASTVAKRGKKPSANEELPWSFLPPRAAGGRRGFLPPALFARVPIERVVIAVCSIAERPLIVVIV